MVQWFKSSWPQRSLTAGKCLGQEAEHPGSLVFHPGSTLGSEGPRREAPREGGSGSTPCLGFQEPPASLSPWQDGCVTTWRSTVWGRARADQRPHPGCLFRLQLSSVQSLSHVRLCNPMHCSMPGFPVHHQLPELT